MKFAKDVGEYLRYDKSLKNAFPFLKAGLVGYKVVIRRHRGASPKVKELIGYYPTGEWQVLVTKKKSEWSVVKGMATFGEFEVMRTEPWSNDPFRFSKVAELINHIKNEK